MLGCLCRMFWGVLGLGWLMRPTVAESKDDPEAQRWRERRRRFRSKVRAALAELLTDDQAGA